MRLEEGRALGDLVIGAVSELVTRIEVVGSIRRKKFEVSDVDIILTPKRSINLDDIVGVLTDKFGFEKNRGGSKLAQVVKDGVEVDLWVTTKGKWGLMRLLKTGSARHNIKLSALAKKQGKKITELPNMRTEEAIFKELGLSYVLPEERER